MGLFRRKSSVDPSADAQSETKSNKSRKGSFLPVRPSSQAPVVKQDSIQQKPPPANGLNTTSTIQEYHLPEPPDPLQDPAGYLRSIHAVRARSRFVLGKAKRNELTNFRVDMTKFKETANYVTAIIKVGVSRLPTQ